MTNKRFVVLGAVLLLVGIPGSVAAQGDKVPPIQAAERSLAIVASDGTYTNYACITTGMHPGQGQAGPGYDAVTYNVGVFLQDKPGNWDGSQATANMEGIACRLMYQGPDVFDVNTGKPFPPLPRTFGRPATT
jgi:hypothetical protein